MMNGITDDCVGPVRNQPHLGELICERMDDMGRGTVPPAAAHPTVLFPAVGKPTGTRHKRAGAT